MRAFRVDLGPADEDAATAALFELGTLGVHVTQTPSGGICFLAYFPGGVEAGHVRAALHDLPGPPGVEETEVPEVDWVARFREGFRRFQAGGFEIVPEWESDSPGSNGVDRLVVDPGRAFGTGTHETTRLCLEALAREAARRPLRRVADLGTGTGILGLAAARRGARLVVGVDDDPEALRSARRHRELNGETLLLVQGDGARALRPGGFDLVLANLMAPLLLERRDEIAALLSPTATLVLSGLLREDVDAVDAAYRAVGARTVAHDGEWAALVYRREPGP